MAKRFGLDLPYEHDMYLWGPCSSTLTAECYDLEENPERYREARPELPPQFRSGEFLQFVRGRSNGWLEVATTLLSKRKSISKRSDVLESTESSKYGFTREFIHKTMRDLEGAGLIECYR